MAGLVDRSLSALLKARGFADSSIHAHWAEIVGAHLAPWSEPVSLRWPVRPPGADPDAPRDAAVLTIRVDGAFALELQHLAPQVVARVNSFIGWRCVAKLALKQGPVRKAEPAAPRRRAVLTSDSSRRLDAMLDGVESAGLKTALQRLGVQVLGRR